MVSAPTSRRCGDQPDLPKPLPAVKHPPVAESQEDDPESPDLAQDDKAPAADSTLQEAEHILLDYVGLLAAGTNNPVTLGRR